MKTKLYQNNDEWLKDRERRITGTRAGSLISKKDGYTKLKGFYELVAERIAIPPTNENTMDRGHRLEQIAIDRFTEETGIKVNTDLVIWERDEAEEIAISPDGQIFNEDNVVTEAVEVKCKSSAEFIEQYLKREVPSLHKAQSIQYFVVNDDLKTLYFVYYDNRMPIDIFWIMVKREDVAEEIAEYLQMEREVLAQIDIIEKQFTF